MRQLIYLALGLALFFASTFLIIKMTGILSVEDIKLFLTEAHEVAPVYVALAVILLLVADLFIAVPTLTVTILSGFFLGFPLGFFAAATGLLTAGTLGYTLSYAYGPKLLNRLQKDERKLDEMGAVFSRYGGLVLVICRAMPILPEVSCCLAGATRMKFPKFIAAFLLGTVPYALIATWAGSKSSLEDPKPAILAALGISLILAGSWTFLFRRYKAEQES